MMVNRVVGLAACAAVCGGCFTWSAAEPSVVGPGDRIRARLTLAEMERVGAVTGREERVVEGDVLQADGGAEPALVVTLPLRSEPGIRQPSLRASVTLEASGMETLETRSLDVFRTVLVGVVAAVASGIVVDELFTGRGNTEDEVPDPDAAIRIPLLRLMFH